MGIGSESVSAIRGARGHTGQRSWVRSIPTDADVTCPTLHMRACPALVQPQRFPARLPVGAFINQRYLVEGYLSSGGFSDVYRSFDIETGQRVALKVLKFIGGPDLQRNAEARFALDAASAARIEHPNVVRILACHQSMELHLPDSDASAHYRRLFFAMELLEGHTLAAELAHRGRLAPGRAARLVLGCLEGLAVGHLLGIVHKDIKPSNLFLVHPDTERERLTLLDFGVARVADSDQAILTSPGDLYCTPRYGAPEYLKNGEVQPAVDVYQMALVLAEMLTGEPVVQGQGIFECTLAHLQGVEVPTALHATAFEQPLRRALDRDPQRRYPDAGAFLTALRWRTAAIRCGEVDASG